MSAWLKRISHNCFIALAAPMVLLVASLPVFAQDQQGQPQPQQQPLTVRSATEIVERRAWGIAFVLLGALSDETCEVVA
jgi:hypothetical protein